MKTTYKGKNGLLVRNGVSMVVPFMLITACFALWGFTNDMTTTIVSVFSKIFRMNAMESGLVNVSNYFGYFIMAIPAALFIRRFQFKAGVLMGLGIYAVGALLFFPAKAFGTFPAFLLAYFVMTCGLAFLETSCHPFVYSLGSEEGAIIRLNLAQAFNALGAVIGMFVAHDYVQAGMSQLSKTERMNLPLAQFNIVKDHDLGVLIQPYLFISVLIIILMIVIRIRRIKVDNDTRSRDTLRSNIREIISKKNYREGVLAEFFYVGAQVACWTYIIHYGARIFVSEGMTETMAEMEAQKYNIAAIILFAASRFVCSWLLKFFAPGRLLSFMAIIAITALGGVILFTDRNGLYCLVLVSGCMSLMFSTIYGITLRGLGKHVKLASAGLTMSVFGGSVLPAIQAVIIDFDMTLFCLPAVNISFVMPMISFIVVALYGHRAFVRYHITHET